MLPFIPDAEIEEKFRKYFAPQWQERLLVSLHNFISVSLEKVSPPALVNYVLQAMESRNDDAVISLLVAIIVAVEPGHVIEYS